MGTFAWKKIRKSAGWASEFGRGFVKSPKASLRAPFLNILDFDHGD